MKEMTNTVVVKRKTLSTVNIVQAKEDNVVKINEKKHIDKEVLDEFQKINNDYGNALRLMEYPKNDVLGREKEIEALSKILERPETPVAILLGEAGTGKTSMVETWYRRINVKHDDCISVALSIGQLSTDEPTLKKRLTSVFDKLAEFERFLKKSNPKAYVTLFIDEVHTVVSTFGAQTKIGGDILKEVLAKPPIRVITATTEGEYEKNISSDIPFSRRFKPIALSEISSELTHKVLRNRLEVFSDKADKEKSKEIADLVSDETLLEIITANKLYREQYKEPAKSIDVIETMIGDFRVTGNPLDIKMVHDIFRTQYNIELDFKANVDRIFEIVKSRVKGQPVALASVKIAIQRIAFELERTDKPRATLLLSGSTGVGKTELAKSLSVGIYETESSMKFFNMPDYALESSEPLFRRDLARHLSRKPSCVVLLDELEKAHIAIRQSLLSILDEGIVSYSKVGADGYESTERISLKNAIIIGTTNAGADMYKSQNKYSRASDSIDQENKNEVTTELIREFRRTEPQVREALMAEGFAPELLNRFQGVVPFRALSEQTMIEIAENVLKRKCDLILESRNITIKFNKKQNWIDKGYPYETNEVAMFVVVERANQADSNSGGARAIHRVIENDFMSSLYDALSKYPDEKKFVATTNGNSQFESKSQTSGEGEIVFIPLTLTN